MTEACDQTSYFSIPGRRTELGTEYSYYWGIADFTTLVNLLPFICRFPNKLRHVSQEIHSLNPKTVILSVHCKQIVRKVVFT